MAMQAMHWKVWWLHIPRQAGHRFLIMSVSRKLTDTCLFMSETSDVTAETEDEEDIGDIAAAF
jgi:hypothetical protein